MEFFAYGLAAVSWLGQVLWAFLPAFGANMTPPLVTAAVLAWNRRQGGRQSVSSGFPIWPSKLGKNKSWRGVVAAVITSTGISILQYGLRDYIPYLKPFRLPESSLWVAAVVGFLLGFGAMLGDIAKSFVKRNWKKIPPGAPWPIWDQIDFPAGSVFVLWIASWVNVIHFPGLLSSVVLVGWLFFFTWQVTIRINRLAHRCRLKEQPH